jgi:tetratricopeptide (TPR) repeat protein
MLQRRYDEMRAMYAELKTASSPKADELMKKLKRQDTPLKGETPEEVAEIAMMAWSSSTPSTIFLDKKVADEVEGNTAKLLKGIPNVGSMSPAMLGDVMRSAIELTTESEGTVSHVAADAFGSKTGIFIVGTKGKGKLFGTSDSPHGIGRFVLGILAKNDEKTATKILDWYGADASRSNTMEAALFRLIWSAQLPRTRQMMELAAAVLTGTTAAARTAPIFKKCGASTTEGQFVCDWMLASDYMEVANWTDLEEHAKEWATRSKQRAEGEIVAMRARALAHLGRFDEADQVLSEALKASPSDKELQMGQIEIACGHGQLQRAAQLADALAKPPDADAQELNDAAWVKFLEGSDLGNAKLIAHRALQVDAKSTNILNTMAAIEAETNELAEAKQNLDAGFSDEPLPGDWYVHGRILEQLGLTDDAIAGYRKVTAKHDNLMPDSQDLAARRLKGLGVTK